MYRLDNPLVVQGDGTVLLEVHAARYEEGRDALCRFAELEKSPEHVHTYRISPLSLWNAASAGLGPEEVIASLTELGKYPLPEHVAVEIRETMARHGRIKLLPASSPDLLRVVFDDELLARQARSDRRVEHDRRGVRLQRRRPAQPRSDARCDACDRVDERHQQLLDVVGAHP